MSNEPFPWTDELAIKFAADFAAQRVVGDAPVNIQEYLDAFKGNKKAMSNTQQPFQWTKTMIWLFIGFYKIRQDQNIGKDDNEKIMTDFIELMSNKVERPPLGIIPEWLWMEQRYKELGECIVKCLEAGKEIPQDWIDEKLSIGEWLTKRKKPSDPTPEPKHRCGICGGETVLIRGIYPGDDKRSVCPTCTTERLDQINDISSRHYGQACQNK